MIFNPFIKLGAPITGQGSTKSFRSGMLADQTLAGSGTIAVYESSTTPVGYDYSGVITGRHYVGGTARAAAITFKLTWTTNTGNLYISLDSDESGTELAASSASTASSGSLTVSYTTTGTEAVYPIVKCTGSHTQKMDAETYFQGYWS